MPSELSTITIVLVLLCIGAIALSLFMLARQLFRGWCRDRRETKRQAQHRASAEPVDGAMQLGARPPWAVRDVAKGKKS